MRMLLARAMQMRRNKQQPGATGPRLKTQQELDAAVAVLIDQCPDLARAHALAGTPPIRHRNADFAGLANIIVAQQVSTASARAIWARVADGLGVVTPKAILSRDEDALRALGLSRPKVRALQAAATAATDGTLDLDAFRHQPDDAVRAALTGVKGIGPWTADIYLLFCLGRADVWPAGDLAVMEALQLLRALDAVPRGDARYDLAESWRPYRGAAALLLWAYYGAVKRPGTLG
jgi:DNA-3-methyladenine glycosylase II